MKGAQCSNIYNQYGKHMRTYETFEIYRKQNSIKERGFTGQQRSVKNRRQCKSETICLIQQNTDSHKRKREVESINMADISTVIRTSDNPTQEKCSKKLRKA